MGADHKARAMIIGASSAGCAVIPASVSMAIRASMANSHGFMGPLAVPAEADLIDLVGIADPETPFPRQLKHSRRPTVVLLGDDPGLPDGMGGPDAWRCTEKLRRWVRAVLVHGAGGEAEHYAECVRAARKVGRVALIETTSRHAQAWARRLACPRTLLILPSMGPHPLVGAEVVQ